MYKFDYFAIRLKLQSIHCRVDNNRGCLRANRTQFQG